MSEKTDLSLAILPVFACFCPIARRVQPTLKNTMSKLTVIATATVAAAKFSANSSRIVIPSRIPPPGLFARMSKRAIGPVMAAAASALPDLELKHSEVIRRVRISIIIINVVVRQEFLEKGFFSFGRIHKHVTAIKMHGPGGGSTAAEKLSWWDLNLPWAFLVEVAELVRVVKLVLLLISTNASHIR